MRDEQLIEELRESIRRRSQRPPQELWDELIRRGVIDDQGNVLLRMPEPPRRTKKKSSDSSNGKDET